VALDPSNPDVVYLGTGEYTTQSSGDGLFRSTDGGATWLRIATTADVGAQCSKIMVNPANPNVIHVTGRGGHARSTDGGNTWSKPYTVAACSDLAVDPTNPSIVYIARHSSGIYKSTDGGTNFTKLTNGLPASGFGRIVMALAPSNPNVLYAAFVDGSNGLLGFYKTTNGGTLWTVKPSTPNFPFPQGWYDCFVGVDPNDENTVYGGGVFPSYAPAGVIKSTDGGDSWDDITVGFGGTQLHPDQHAITFGPDGRLWIGNDGGVWNSTDDGDTWINVNNRLTVTQNYNIAVHPTDPSRAMGGTQDNGTVGRDLGTEQWPQVRGGDGGFLAYDFDNPVRRYVTYVYLTVYRLSPAFANITGPWQVGGDPVEPVDFIAPLVMDPNDSTTLLGGTNRVWRTTNATSSPPTWTAISSSLGATIKAIAVAPSDSPGPSDNIYVGNNRVWFTDSAGLAWEERSTGLPTSSISDIMVHPEDKNIAYVSFYRSSGDRIFRTDSAGLTWTSVTGSLISGVTPNALAVDWDDSPHGLYIGSGSGIWWSLDQGATWERDGTDLPNVDIGDLFIDRPNRQITAGTYGRGAWRADLPYVPTCGDGLVEDPELCDLAIAEPNPGACPTDCDTGDPCLVGTLIDPGTCTAHCDIVEIVLPADDDGCCPAGAHAANDNDCAPVCGNAICEPGEEISCTSDCNCVNDDDCNDNYVCTDDRCITGTCNYLPGVYGDVDDNGFVTLADLFCVLDGFQGDFSVCSFQDDDVQPCAGNGVITIADLFAVLDAFQAIDPCCGG